MKHLEITVGVLLLVQAFQLAAPQTTRSVPTIDQSWLRRRNGEPNEIPGDVVEEERDQDNGNYFTSGTSSGALEEENMADQGRGTAELARLLNITESLAIQNVTIKPTESPRGDTTAPTPPAAAAANATTIQPEAGNNINSTSTPQNVTVQPTEPPRGDTTAPPAAANATTVQPEAGNDVNSTSTPQNVTAVPDSSNGTNTTSAPEATSTAKPAEVSVDKTEFNNSTAVTNSTEFNNNTAVTNSTGAETFQTTTFPPFPVNPEGSPAMTAAVDESDESTGDTAGRGSELDLQNNARQQAWGAVLATAVAVACVGLVAYIILRKKYPKGFTHRKLVEEYPSDPVLRLDNSEPLDLNFSHMGYRNPGLHGDDIQMGRIPGRP